MKARYPIFIIGGICLSIGLVALRSFSSKSKELGSENGGASRQAAEMPSELAPGKSIAPAEQPIHIYIPELASIPEPIILKSSNLVQRRLSFLSLNSAELSAIANFKALEMFYLSKETNSISGRPTNVLSVARLKGLGQELVGAIGRGKSELIATALSDRFTRLLTLSTEGGMPMSSANDLLLLHLEINKRWDAEELQSNPQLAEDLYGQIKSIVGREAMQKIGKELEGIFLFDFSGVR